MVMPVWRSEVRQSLGNGNAVLPKSAVYVEMPSSVSVADCMMIGSSAMGSFAFVRWNIESAGLTLFPALSPRRESAARL